MQMGDSKAPILLVEGDAVDEQRAVRAFQETGLRNRLLVARTAEHGLTLLRACAKGLRFGLVLLDLHIPKLGAADLLRKIRRDPSICNVPVVVMAPANASDQVIEEASQDANTWVRRPSDQGEYRNLLDRLVKLFVNRQERSVKSG